MTELTPKNHTHTHLAQPNLATNQSVRFVVTALTRHGAYLQVNRDRAELFSGRNNFAHPLACLTMDTFRTLASAEWIELTGLGLNGQGLNGPSHNGKSVWVLAKGGREAVRRARSGGTEVGADEARDLIADEAPIQAPADPVKAAARPAPDHDSPLAWLHRRRDKQGRPLLSSHAFDAGERLRADFWFAAMTPRVTASWSPIGSDRNAQRAGPSNGLDMSDNVVAAKERVRRALAAVGPELSGILIDVCCHEKGIEDTERAIGWPVRSGRIVLQLALERLACHYGLVPPGQSGSWTSEGRIRAWGDGQHRPTLTGDQRS